MNVRAKTQGTKIAQDDPPDFVTVRIPRDVDAELERALAGTGVTKREAVAEALRQYLDMEQQLA